MTTFDQAVDATAVIPRVQEQPLRRIRGLRITALPSFSLLAQVGGGVAALSGVYMQWGTAVALIVGGVAATVLGMLKEGGKI